MKTIAQLIKFIEDSFASAESFNYDVKRDPSYDILVRVLKNPASVDVKRANAAYDNFLVRLDAVRIAVRKEERRLQKKGKEVQAPTVKITPKELLESIEKGIKPEDLPIPEEEYEGEEKVEEEEEEEPYEPKEETELTPFEKYNKNYIKDLLQRNPRLRKEIKKILAKELVKGDLTEEEYNEIVDQKAVPYADFARIPELRNQAVEVAQKEYIKGNIDETEYHRVKNLAEMAEQPIAEHSQKVPFIDIVNYKPKRRVLLS